MPRVNCLILKDSRVLMKRVSSEDTQTLGLPEAVVKSGESPLAACIRLAEQATGWRLVPSCVAVLLLGADQESGEYYLSFIAQAANEHEVSAVGDFEWIQVADVGSMDVVSRRDRELVPLLLSSHGPVSVVVHVEGSHAAAALGPASRIDPARLSPLVFAEAT